MGELLLIFLLQNIFSYQISLDSHIHYQTKGFFNSMSLNRRPITKNDVASYLEEVFSKKNPSNRFFLISEAYLENSGSTMIQVNQNLINLSKRNKRSIPICGLSLSYADKKENLNNCFDHNVKGYKIHLAEKRYSL